MFIDLPPAIVIECNHVINQCYPNTEADEDRGSGRIRGSGRVDKSISRLIQL